MWHDGSSMISVDKLNAPQCVFSSDFHCREGQHLLHFTNNGMKDAECIHRLQAYAHYQRACSNESARPAGPGPGKALWDEDPLKRVAMYAAVAAEESAFPVGRAQDPRDPFDIALEEYQAIPDSVLTIHQSKHGNFMGPSMWA